MFDIVNTPQAFFSVLLKYSVFYIIVLLFKSVFISYYKDCINLLIIVYYYQVLEKKIRTRIFN